MLLMLHNETRQFQSSMMITILVDRIKKGEQGIYTVWNEIMINSRHEKSFNSLEVFGSSQRMIRFFLEVKKNAHETLLLHNSEASSIPQKFQ